MCFVTDIQDVAFYKREMYFLHENNNIKKYELSPVAKLVSKLFHLQKYVLCAQIANCCHSTVTAAKSRRQIPVSMITDLKVHLSADNNQDLAELTETLLEKLEIPAHVSEDEKSSVGSTSHKSGSSFDKLESGIYVIRHRTESGNSDCETRNSEALSDHTQDSSSVDTMSLASGDVDIEGSMIQAGKVETNLDEVVLTEVSVTPAVQDLGTPFENDVDVGPEILQADTDVDKNAAEVLDGINTEQSVETGAGLARNSNGGNLSKNLSSDSLASAVSQTSTELAGVSIIDGRFSENYITCQS